ncbi:MAG: cache domain-containing protein [Spirochaetales bacterium]|nr:cache domain-containing protein [Spirochaetales bacterium]
MTRKSKLITVIRIWGIVSLVLLAAIIIGIDLVDTYRGFRVQCEGIREDYVNEQKKLVKREVERVVNDIHYSKAQYRQKVKEEIKLQTYEVYNTALSIYNNNEQKKTKNEIQRMILDVFNPNASGNDFMSRFIINTDGKVLFFGDKPDIEGSNILNIRNREGRYFVKDIIHTAQKCGEAFHSDLWNSGNKEAQKTCFIKLFKPYSWILGTCINSDSIVLQVQKSLIGRIASIKFGKEGYIFVNKWDGTVLVSNGKILSGNKKLWEEFGPKTREVFNKEIEAAKKSGGDYIYYKWIKLSDPQKVSPKVSFIYGIPEWKWIVGSGVYLDDVDKNIEAMASSLKKQIWDKILRFILIAGIISGIFIYVSWLFNRRLKKDFNLFISFFSRAALSNESIDTESVRFAEFHELSDYANRMLADKEKAQQDLMEEKERLSVTLQSIGDGVIAADTLSRVILVNAAAEKLTGWSQQDARGRELTDVFNIINEDTRERVKNPVERVFTENRVVGLANHTVLVSKDGTEYNIMDSAAPIKDSKGKIHGVVLVFRDVTEKLKVEKELAKVNKLESIGILAGGIAHDFNNILTGIFGNIKLAQMALPKDHETFDYLKKAGDALERATNLTKQLLTFAKGGDPLIETVNIRGVVMDSVSFNLSGSSVKAVYEIPVNIWQVKADKGQISQVIANLTINAKDAMPEGGRIFISMENVSVEGGALVDTSPAVDSAASSASVFPGDYVKIIFRDEGIGIPKENLSKVFDPYFTTKEAGNGLGLATTHSIIKKHGGYIVVDSTPRAGTVFTIYLPADRSSKVKTGGVDSDAGTDLKHLSGYILVVDDEEMIRDVTKRMLKILGYTCDFASEGREALEKYVSAKESGHPFNAVIMDLTIRGGMGGKEAVAEIIAHDPDAAVIVSSGYSNDPVMANYVEYGFKGRITKPFKMEALKKEIERVIWQQKEL